MTRKQSVSQNTGRPYHFQKKQVKTGNADGFFNIKGVMIEWVPEGLTVNQKYFTQFLIKLRERVRMNFYRICFCS